MAELKLTIIPEFERKAIKDFASEVKSNLKDAMDGVGDATGGGKKGSSKGGGIGNIFSTALKGLGIASGIGIIVQIIQQFKPLIKIAGQIIKILFEFLRPIADAITLLLKPILLILRPILKIFNQMMQPFRKIVNKLSIESAKAIQEGDIGRGLALAGLAFTTLLKPISDLLLNVQGELLKLAVEGIEQLLKGTITVLAELFKVIFPFAKDGIENLKQSLFKEIDKASDFAKGAIDSGIKWIQDQGNAALYKASQGLGVDLTDEFTYLFQRQKSPVRRAADDLGSFITSELTRALTVGSGRGGLLEPVSPSFRSDIAQSIITGQNTQAAIGYGTISSNGPLSGNSASDGGGG